jgi:hypothetical protein
MPTLDVSFVGIAHLHFRHLIYGIWVGGKSHNAYDKLKAGHIHHY